MLSMTTSEVEKATKLLELYTEESLAKLRQLLAGAEGRVIGGGMVYEIAVQDTATEDLTPLVVSLDIERGKWSAHQKRR